jgi:uncharacterized GH25 family protein
MNLMTPRRACLIAVTILAGAPLAAAHEFWIQPSSFHPASGAVVQVHLRVGDQFPGDPVARDPERFVSFAAYGPAGESPVAGREGMDPAGLARITQPGIYTLAYRSTTAEVTLDAAKFEKYLAEKGLENVIHARAESGQSQAAASEIYSRCCKSLVVVGDRDQEGFNRVVGQRLELTAMDNPCAAAPGTTIRFRIELESKPSEGLLVIARHPEHPDEVVSGRSASDGVVALTLPYSGMWVVSSVQMVEAPESSGADWESLWASLSFELNALPTTVVGANP